MEDLDKPLPKRRCRSLKQPHYTILEDIDDFSDYEEELLELYSKEAKPTPKEAKAFLVKLTMQNTVMMFRKIVNHPYLIHFPLDPTAEKRCLLVNEDLITTSGKMMVLDVLLEKLKKTGHKVSKFNFP